MINWKMKSKKLKTWHLENEIIASVKGGTRVDPVHSLRETTFSIILGFN